MRLLILQCWQNQIPDLKRLYFQISGSLYLPIVLCRLLQRLVGCLDVYLIFLPGHALTLVILLHSMLVGQRVF